MSTDSGQSSKFRYKDTPKPYRDPEVLHRLYWHEGMNQTQISEHLGCAQGTIGEWMRKLHVPRRSLKEARRTNQPYNEVHLATSHKGHVEWHPRCVNTIAVHRLLAVNKFGFDAVCGMNVHHKNEIPWDNREENLELMTRAEHTGHHASKYSEEFKAEIVERYENEDISSRKLADEYDGVSYGSILRWHREQQKDDD